MTKRLRLPLRMEAEYTEGWLGRMGWQLEASTSRA